MTGETPAAAEQKGDRKGRRIRLGEAVDAPRSQFTSANGWRIAYYADTSVGGRPLVLVHSINAAPSSYEVKPLFDHYRAERPVYSLDLPGFGHSERRPAGYTPQFFADVIAQFLEQVVGHRADVVALSLSAEFAACAIGSKPGSVASLAIIAPTGFSQRLPPGPVFGRIVHNILKTPGLSQVIFNLVASKRSIRYFLGQSFVGEPTREILDYAYATAHQPGARHATLVFLSLLLFTPEALDRFYAKLTDLPVLAIADRDPYVGFERLDDFVARHPNWSRQRVAPNMGLPHWERLPETVAALNGLWGRSRGPV
jgi:pimeloyl-ACP methyl ester carboxylesterase